MGTSVAVALPQDYHECTLISFLVPSGGSGHETTSTHAATALSEIPFKAEWLGNISCRHCACAVSQATDQHSLVRITSSCLWIRLIECASSLVTANLRTIKRTKIAIEVGVINLPVFVFLKQTVHHTYVSVEYALHEICKQVIIMYMRMRG